MTAARISANLASVRDRIAEAARRSGRLPENVTLVAVTKYAQIEQVLALVDAGVRDLGESRPQELWHKADELDKLRVDSEVRWHLVGPLQRNKARRTLPYVSLIHSVESWRLLEAIDRLASERGRPTAVLLEVNTSGEAAKHGFAPAELPPLADRLTALEHVRVRGLMTIAGLADGTEKTRREFARLRELRDEMRAQTSGAPPERVAFDELSMGMSGDFEIAVEEGATLVRVGSALFE
jgi:hypothetical protein